MLIIAEGGLTWTPETYYVIVAVVQLIAILVTFRMMNLRPEYNTFPSALMVVGGTNAIAYFTANFGLVGVLLTGFSMFILIAMMTRADVVKTIVGWLVLMAVYWAVAYGAVEYEEHETEAAEEAFVQQFGPMPYALMEGGLDPEPMGYEEYQELRDADGEDDEE